MLFFRLLSLCTCTVGFSKPFLAIFSSLFATLAFSFLLVTFSLSSFLDTQATFLIHYEFVILQIDFVYKYTGFYPPVYETLPTRNIPPNKRLNMPPKLNGYIPMALCEGLSLPESHCADHRDTLCGGSNSVYLISFRHPPLLAYCTRRNRASL